MGEFYIHVEDHLNMEATMSNDTMQGLGLQQYVNKTMHHQGNIFALIFTEVNSDVTAPNCKHLNTCLATV